MLTKKLPLISSALIFLYSVTLLISGKSYSYIAITLCIVSLLILPVTLKNRLPSDFYKIGISLVGYFIITGLSLLLLGGKLSNLDIPSRTIFILPAFIFLLSYPPKREWVFIGILIGSLLCGLIALYHYHILHIRAFYDFGYMVIQSGNMAMSLGVFSLVIAVQYIKEKRFTMTSFALLCAFAGVLASFLSGARGGWIIAPFVIIWLLVLNRQLISSKAIIGLTIILICSTLLSQNMLKKRVQAAMYEITQISENNDNNSSTGARLEMWKSGIYIFIDNPLFGIGYQDRQENNRRLVDEGLVDPIVLEYRRLHNSFIEELSMKGLIGFIALMAFFCTPLYLFIVEKDVKNNAFSQLGIAHIILVMSYCFTQNYINHHSGMLQYLMYTTIFYVMVYQHKKPAQLNKVTQ